MTINLDELRERLDAADSTEKALDYAVGLYQEAAAYIAALKDFQNECKDLIGEVFVETGQPDVTTSSGRAYVTRPGVTVTYDRKGLDTLCRFDKELGEVLAPFRRETERPGTLTIRALK